MRYRKLDENDDYVFGGNLASFFIDQPEAPAQAVKTRLMLQLGEWFVDTSDGTPWKTKVLGKYTSATRDPVLRNRILGTQGVSAIALYASQFDPETRQYDVQAQIDTVYGKTTIQETI
ncbi:hypothetical protein [Ochrobactrum chromiisoli]|uniref:Uncharacterized protein n=1 Tax=Ochrobactrum chromiisoli TaxID=2993941 RepID=A0ABT3QUG6_9HYPH|nr:hypothetical protein [Ochrobactrum chromiisoli]MCX2699265.1 hypothetical protein [Ochrobactrum chromiisoli]